jgi:prepilin-type N-terminal cleavage/methylation domain-containing protein
MGNLRQTGFSLLELLIVLGLMATAAVLALSTVGNSDNQRRFEETRSKLERFQKAIIGEPQVINGQLSLNGFVADMGRLPFNLDELLTEPTDCDGDNSIDSDGDTDPSIDLCLWAFDSDVDIWHGWHGPYVRSINTDYRDGWGNGSPTTDNQGWDWDDTTVTDELTITSGGLDDDIATDLTDPEVADYGTSSLQLTTITALDYSIELPSNPLRLTVEKIPFCGQCRDNDNDNNPDCATAGHSWNNDLDYCVENTATSANACDAVASEETTWIPLFSYCSDALYTNETDCTVALETWTAIDGTPSNQCSDYSTPAYSFIVAGNENICARIIRANHGLIVTNTHKSTDATVVDITASGQSGSANEQFTFSPNIETDETTPVAGLTLPQGVIRVGLYIYDTATNTCTENPYPVESAQARSKVITLSSDYPLNLGTSSQPILLQWKSQ